MPALTHVLFETATGFNIFSVSGKESIAEFNESNQQSLEDFAKFSKICKKIANVPFTSAENALENINTISEGIVTELLQTFLKQNFPKSSGVILGVSDNKLAASIQQTLSIGCISDSQTAEIIRWIRYHINSFTKLKDSDQIKAQLGLGHSYSRSKVKFNVHKVDNMIIQSICLLDTLDKDLNTFYMRMREWYSWHFPELIKVLPAGPEQNIRFVKLAKFIQNKANLNSESLEEITEILGGDESLAKDVVQAAKTSMGGAISVVDLESLMHFADRVISLEEYHKKLSQYLAKKMNIIAPNVQALVGDRIGSRLIARAGSLTSLAKYPASTVQILGAEKALFRAIKSRGKTPKYGIIFNSGFISNAPKHKGRIARCLANKITIASRIDCFNENATSKFGAVLKQQVDDRIKFFNSGVAPKRNLDVMREVIAEVEKDFPMDDVEDDTSMKVDEKKSSKKSSSSKKRPLEEEPVEDKKSKKSSKKEDEKVVKKHKSEPVETVPEAMNVDEKKSSKKSSKKEEEPVEDKKSKKSSKKEEEPEEKKSKKSSKKEEEPEEKKSSKKAKKEEEEKPVEEKKSKKSSKKEEEPEEKKSKKSSKKSEEKEEEPEEKKSKKSSKKSEDKEDKKSKKSK
ncbi:NOP5 family protein [Tieghemostelium lacteum]|uniref:Nucleolar protein 56 n=1 Tax=Tieghemostelium lacteum TaxID=361077 RepID=G8FUG4_TIELA|nr:nucleolar protein 5A [Tieghemostelium lacteum]KYR02975.1 NOP5 family protein [Tieghemostelium lacteum]|eukprot:KYR02975.1 NOP5 family protein [Tieghemostelium lacteum]